MYIDADEMEKVFDAAFERITVGSGLPGAALAAGAEGNRSASSYDSALTPMEDDDHPPLVRARGSGRKQVISEDEYLTQSDEE